MSKSPPIATLKQRLEQIPATSKRQELWFHYSGVGAAIADEPPPEVAAAGHDRWIIPIKEENIEAWLNPDAKELDALYAILDDRARPHYEHRMEA